MKEKQKQEKVKKQKTPKDKSLRKLIPYYKKFKGSVFLILFFCIVDVVVSVLFPILEGNQLAAVSEINLKSMLFYTSVMLALSLFLRGFSYLWYFVNSKLNKKTNLILQKDVIKSLNNLEIKCFDKNSSGTFIARINEDVGNISGFLPDLVERIFIFISSVIMIIYVAFLNIYIFAFIIINIALSFIFESLRAKAWYKNNKELKKNREALVGMRSELVRGMRDIKSLHYEDNISERINDKQNEITSANYKLNLKYRRYAAFIQTFNNIMQFLYMFLCIALFKFTPFTVALFFIINVYRNRALQSMGYFASIKEQLSKARLSATRVFELMENKEFKQESFGNITLQNVKGEIEFKNVKFQYGKENNEVLNNLNFKVKPNTKVAIVGKSGGGKSTVLSLLMKFYRLEENCGQILLDGENINNLTKNSLRNNIALVLQTPYLFNFTIKENLKLSNNNATDEEIEEACKKAQIHDFIVSQKDGYDSLLGENGITVSGGQKQRLAIARALLVNSKVILFDEATSALDNESQSKIKTVIDDLAKNHTIIIVAHRLSTIVDCDNIIVLNEGKVVGEGTHDVLLKTNESYINLYKTENDS